MGVLVLASLIAQHETVRSGYFDKAPIYLILDALILSSPLTGAVALAVLVFDPIVRGRPKGWWKASGSRLRIRSGLWKRLVRRMAFVAVCGTLCGLGMLTLMLHLLDLIP